MKISEHSFLITGGASGLGKATATLLTSLGGNVVLCDLNQAEGESVAQALGDRARFVRAGVTSEEDVQAAVQCVLDEFGSLNGVISCAGLGDSARMLGRDGPMPLSSFQRIIDVNLTGTFNVARLTAATMASNEPADDGERGVIINTASIAAFEGQVGQVAYSASKGGVVAMTLPLARELSRVGIRVNAIAPGIFETPMMEGLSEPARRALTASVPFPSRLGQPSEFAGLVRTIIENRMLNGEVIRLDAALRLASR